jgi:hypothetical protein
MRKPILKSIWFNVAIAYGLLISCATIGMIVCPRSFEKFFSTAQIAGIAASGRNYYWDVEHYAAMTISTACNAFYPLWPWLIKNLFHPQTMVESANELKVVGIGIFILDIPLFCILIDRILKCSKTTLSILLAFAISPAGFMRIMGYTESIYCLFAIFFIWNIYSIQSERNDNKSHYMFVVAITIVMSLTRPSLIQIIGSAFATLATLSILKLQSSTENVLSSIFDQFKTEIKLSLSISIAAIIGYSIYGYTCWQLRGDFLAPFHDQSNWGRKLGFYPDLLFVRTSMFEAMALYLPSIIFATSLAFVKLKDKFQLVLNTIPQSIFGDIWLLYPAIFIPATIVRLKSKYQYLKQQWYQPQFSSIVNIDLCLESNYLFWFSTYFSLITSIGIFLLPARSPLPNLGSLDRQIFAIPFFYVSLGYLCTSLNSNKVFRTVYFWILISIVATIEQWIKYGNDLWIN